MSFSGLSGPRGLKVLFQAGLIKFSYNVSNSIDKPASSGEDFRLIFVKECNIRSEIKCVSFSNKELF